MPFEIVRNDITKMQVDAIVNAANTSLQMGGGVCGAIFSAAGKDKLQKACDNLAPIQTGEAVITRGFDLPAKYIIHAAGPVYQDGKHNEAALLRSCYENALNLAAKHQCDSIAFPLISSGIYGYPKDEALSIATSTISDWLLWHDDLDVALVVFDKTAFAISKSLHGDVKAFVNEHYVDKSELEFSRSRKPWTSHSFDDGAYEAALPGADFVPPPDQMPETMVAAAPMPSKASATITNFMERLDEPFSVTLLRLIDEKGRSDVEVYKRANIDRKLFSKIRSGKGYMPSKKTVVALAVALELSTSETRDLLEQAGFALSRSVLFDVIIEYFISRRKYDIYEINTVLFEYDQPLLGG